MSAYNVVCPVGKDLGWTSTANYDYQSLGLPSLQSKLEPPVVSEPAKNFDKRMIFHP